MVVLLAAGLFVWFTQPQKSQKAAPVQASEQTQTKKQEVASATTTQQNPEADAQSKQAAPSAKPGTPAPAPAPKPKPAPNPTMVYVSYPGMGRYSCSVPKYTIFGVAASIGIQPAAQHDLTVTYYWEVDAATLAQDPGFSVLSQPRTVVVPAGKNGIFMPAPHDQEFSYKHGSVNAYGLRLHIVSPNEAVAPSWMNITYDPNCYSRP